MGCPPKRGVQASGLQGMGSQATLWEMSQSQTQSALHHLRACPAPVERGCFTQGLAH